MARLWNWVDGIPDVKWRCGVYALYRGPQVVYIGRTDGAFRWRIVSHQRRFTFDGIKVAMVDDHLECQRLERKLIYRLRPIENRSIPQTSRHWRDNRG